MKIIEEPEPGGTAIVSEFQAGKFYKNAQYSITYTSREAGTYVSDLFPMSSNSSDIGSEGQPFNMAYVKDGNFSGTVSGSTVSGTTVQGNTVKAGSGSKVEIGQDNESGYVNIHNVDMGSSAIMWHIDTWQNQLRFVRSGATVPGYVDSSGVWGAVFN